MTSVLLGPKIFFFKFFYADTGVNLGLEVKWLNDRNFTFIPLSRSQKSLYFLELMHYTLTNFCVCILWFDVDNVSVSVKMSLNMFHPGHCDIFDRTHKDFTGNVTNTNM